MLKASLIENDAIKLGVRVNSWQEAVKVGTDMLVQSGAVEPCYYDAIINAVNQLGPYIVIAPGLAMPHARPEDGVNRTAFALVTLAEPVKFDGEDEAVHVLVTLAGSDANTHIKAITEIMQLFEDDDPSSETGVDLQSILHCQTRDEILAVLDKKIQ